MNLADNIHLKLITAALFLALGAGCQNSGTQHNGGNDSLTAVDTDKENTAVQNTPTAEDCNPAETLVYSNSSFNSYTENKMRGIGVVSFQLEINDRLDIYNLDDSNFGYLVYNEDETFYMLDMPRKLVARWVVPEADVAQFDFDAEAVDTDREYLYIYANKKRCKVKKADVKYTFNTWNQYMKMQNIQLNACNTLKAAGNNRNLVYQITELRGDSIRIKSQQGCSGEEADFKLVEGWIKWKKRDVLTVNIAPCN